jgi:hypothetical protein
LGTFPEVPSFCQEGWGKVGDVPKKVGDVPQSTILLSGKIEMGDVPRSTILLSRRLGKGWRYVKKGWGRSPRYHPYLLELELSVVVSFLILMK